MKTTEIIVLLACLWHIRVIKSLNIPGHISRIKVCEGKQVMLKANFGNRTVRYSEIYRDSDSKNLMNYYENGTHISRTPRVEYRSPTWIVYRDIGVDDAGQYDMLVFFKDNTSAWPLFDVQVITGCPGSNEFYSPAISYNLVYSGVLEPLPHDRIINIKRGATIAINVTIPPATPPVTCTITGIKPKLTTTMEGAESSTTFCIATFHEIKWEHDSVRVMLEQPHMQPSFDRTINIKTTIPVETRAGVTSGTQSPQDTAEGAKEEVLASSDKDSHHGSLVNLIPVILVMTFVILIVLIILVVYVCRTFRVRSGTERGTLEEQIAMA